MPTRHPICDDLQIPEPTKEMIDEIAENMRENGWNRNAGPSWWYQRKCLVGNTREAAAKIAKVKPYRKLFKGTAQQARSFCFLVEVLRRQLTEPQARKSRDAMIGLLREEGKSIRTIAEEVGASTGTVASTVQRLNSEPEDGEVTGKDGRKQAAHKPHPRCKKCTRTWPNSNASVKGCPQCAELKKAARERSDKALNRRETTGKMKGGKAAFDWRPLRDGFGQLRRQIDTFGRLYGVMKSPDAEKLRDDLAAWHKHFTEWASTVSRMPAPPI